MLFELASALEGFSSLRITFLVYIISLYSCEELGKLCFVSARCVMPTALSQRTSCCTGELSMLFVVSTAVPSSALWMEALYSSETLVQRHIDTRRKRAERCDAFCFRVLVCSLQKPA
jgi:hypothetical protein